MDSDIIAAVIILLMACALFVWSSLSSKEGFEGLEGARCGVDLPTCPQGTKCMNGYCMPPNKPQFPMYSDLPVEPSDPGNLGGFLHTE
jgi:hypothetical protein